MKNTKRRGQIIKLGGELVSTYGPTPGNMKYLINDFYNDQYRTYKTEGFARYGTAGMFNAIMGKEITAGMFACSNMLTAIGARPYDHEGVRIMYDLAQKGNIGASTIRDGDIPDSVMAPIKQIREPYKELPFPFDYGLGLKILEQYDDTAEFDDYVDKMTKNYADGLDTDLLRTTATTQPTLSSEETTLNSISRVIGASTEVGNTYGTTTITADMVSPWGGVASDIYEYRNSGTLNNFDGYVVDCDGGTLTLANINTMYANSMPYWNDQGNPNNKLFGMSMVALEKIGALMEAQNIWRESVFVQRDFNGVKTIPGRDGGGILLNSYRNIPIFMDGNYNYDSTTSRLGTGIGEIHLLDLDYIWMSMLTPVEFRSTDDFAVTRKLREMMVMQSRMELRASKFLGHSKLTNATS